MLISLSTVATDAYTSPACSLASSHVWSFPLPNKNNPNSGVSYFVQIGAASSDELRPLAALFSHISREPCFDTLRTKEQLGYLVHSGGRNQAGSVGFNILVQSNNDPVYLESRIEAFLTGLEKILTDMPEAEFERQKQSYVTEGIIVKSLRALTFFLPRLIDDKLQKVKNLYQESSRLWHNIGNGYYDFKRRERDANLLRPISKSDLLAFFKQYIDPASPTRRKLSVHIKTQHVGPVFDPMVATTFLSELAQLGVPLPEEELAQLIASDRVPALQIDDVVAFARAAVSAASSPNSKEAGEAAAPVLAEGVAEETEKKIEALKAGVAVEHKKEATLREGNILIEDIRAWKAGLTTTEPAKPVVDLSTFKE